MKTLTACQGLPACGKTTWAEDRQNQIVGQGGSCKIVNKDKLRAMLDAGEWSREREKFIIASRNVLIREALRAGHHVICDDTNFGTHLDTLRAIAKNEGAQFEVEDFTDVPLDVCLERDKKRPNYVGENVILDMHQRYLEKPVAPPEWIDGAPRAIIVDVDGTIALMNGRSPFDWHRVGEDKANEPVCRLVRELKNPDRAILFVSGRDKVCHDATLKFIIHNVCNGAGIRLWMRPEGDQRDDRIIKREIYDREIAGKYNVEFVLDDRDKVVRMWRSLGLTCLQVAPGRF